MVSAFRFSTELLAVDSCTWVEGRGRGRGGGMEIGVEGGREGRRHGDWGRGREGGEEAWRLG